MSWVTNFVLGETGSAFIAHLNLVVSDVQVWPGNVNAGGYNLTNLAGLYQVGAVAVNTTAHTCNSTVSSSSGNNTYGVNLAPLETAASSGGTFLAVQVQPQLNGSFTEPAVNALTIASPSLAGGAAITTLAGLTIAAQKVSGVGTGRAIWQEGAVDLNDFAGSTGIGTATPAIPLEVANGGSSPYNLYCSGFAPSIYLGNTSGVNPNTGTGQQVAGFMAIATAAGNYALSKGDLLVSTQSFQSGNSNAIRFAVPINDTGSYGVAMSILRSGNVGIGTLSPSSPLQVAGLPTYASDSAAGSGGLTSGATYRSNAVLSGSATLSQVITALNALAASAFCIKL